MQDTFHTLLTMITMTLQSDIIVFQVRRLIQEVVKPGFQCRETWRSIVITLLIMSLPYSPFCRGGEGLESSILLSSCFHLGVLLLE